MFLPRNNNRQIQTAKSGVHLSAIAGRITFIFNNFVANEMQRLFLISFRYRDCYVSVIMRPAGYFRSPHLVHTAFETPDL